ncbi:MAG: tetratricopeptide repeat protein [bacterium]|nr:tetratricopeptide repeat protein [bacterium]
MNKKFTGVLCILGLSAVLSVSSVYGDGTAAFIQHYEAGQSFYDQNQFSSAIVEFRKALRINYLDNSARIGLVNSYLSRATYYANQENNYDKAANDFRSAIFYLKMYPTKEQMVQNSSSMIASSVENLNQCLKVIGFDTSATSRYSKAEELRTTGNFSAAAYEFSKAGENSNLASKANAQIADLMKLLGNEPRSADYYKIALDLNMTDSAMRMKYARTLDKLGNYDEALAQYNSVLANSKGDMEVLYALERIYLKKLAQTPSDAELNANIGAIKQAQGDFESALNYYGKAEQLNPDNITTRLNVGTLYQQKKEYSKAIKSYDSVLTLYPNNIQANLYKAQALSEMGDKANSLKLYEKVLSIDPNNAVAKNEVMAVMQSTLSPEEYIAYLSKNAVTNKSMQETLYNFAYKLHKDNKLNDAIMAYRAYININPNNADAYVNMAICYASLNDYGNAQNVLNNAKMKFPNNAVIAKTVQDVKSDMTSDVLARASSSYDKKDYKKAIELYSSINPPTEASLFGLAVSYQALGNYDKAIESYKKAEIISPKNAEIPYYIGYLYSEQQKWNDAERYLKKAISMNPNSEAKNIMQYVSQNLSANELSEGISLFEKKQFDLSLQKFNNILKQEPNNAYAYYYRAMIYDEQKKIQFAINDYLNTLKYTKELPVVNYMIAVDYDSLEKYQEALKYYREFVSLYSTNDEFLQYAKSRIQELSQYAS